MDLCSPNLSPWRLHLVPVFAQAQVPASSAQSLLPSRRALGIAVCHVVLLLQGGRPVGASAIRLSAVGCVDPDRANFLGLPGARPSGRASNAMKNLYHHDRAVGPHRSLGRSLCGLVIVLRQSRSRGPIGEASMPFTILAPRAAVCIAPSSVSHCRTVGG